MAENMQMKPPSWGRRGELPAVSKNNIFSKYPVLIENKEACKNVFEDAYAKLVDLVKKYESSLTPLQITCYLGLKDLIKYGHIRKSKYGGEYSDQMTHRQLLIALLEDQVNLIEYFSETKELIVPPKPIFNMVRDRTEYFYSFTERPTAVLCYRDKKNPDGSQGGYIELGAYVSPRSFLSTDSAVIGILSQVTDSRILENSIIENSEVSNSTIKQSIIALDNKVSDSTIKQSIIAWGNKLTNYHVRESTIDGSYLEGNKNRDIINSAVIQSYLYSTSIISSRVEQTCGDFVWRAPMKSSPWKPSDSGLSMHQGYAGRISDSNLNRVSLPGRDWISGNAVWKEMDSMEIKNANLNDFRYTQHYEMNFTSSILASSRNNMETQQQEYERIKNLRKGPDMIPRNNP